MAVITQIPNDASALIFYNLSLQERAQCCSVSQIWNSFLSQDCFWELPGNENYSNTDRKKNILSNSVFSIKELEQNAANFLAKLSFLNAKFICVFPFQPNCNFIVT